MAIINGTSGNDSLTGTFWFDQIYGYEGNDTLNGGTYNDDLYGGDGDDRLIGGYHNDNLYGGNGNDTFVFSSSSWWTFRYLGQDIIHDFVSSSDKIEVSFTGATSTNQFNYDSETGDLSFEGDTFVTLNTDSGFDVTTDIVIL